MADFDLKMIEALARAICLSEGQDPDAKNISVFCDHDNRPLPIWMAFEEQAQAALSVLPLSPEALNALWRGEAVVINETTGLPYLDASAQPAQRSPQARCCRPRRSSPPARRRRRGEPPKPAPR